MKVLTFILVIGACFIPSAISDDCKEQIKPQLPISPTFISILGNKPVTVEGPFFNGAISVQFRFFDVTTITVNGFLTSSNIASCMAPFFYTKGRIQVDMLVTKTDSTVQTLTGFIYTVHHTGEIIFNIVDNGGFELSWDQTVFNDRESLDLELIELCGGIWTSRGVIIEGISNTGSFSGMFDRKGLNMLKNLRNVYVVKLKIRSVTNSVDDCNSCDSAFSKFLFGLGEKTEAELNELCYSWYVQDAGAPKDALHCPPTAQKAKVDTRFEPVDDLPLYNPEADQGFRQRVPSPSGASQRCVYKNGKLLVGPKSGGNVRSVSPNSRLGMNAHFVADLLPWYTCCALIKNQTACALYYERRPSDDGTLYVPPGSSHAYGDPHITTFDGHYYTFNGVGEFWITKNRDKSFMMQGRTEPYVTLSGQKTSAAIITAVVMRQRNCPDSVTTIQLSVVGRNFQLLLDGEEVAYDTTPNAPKRTIIHNGASISISSSSDIKVCFASGFSFAFAHSLGAITMTTLVDVELKGKVSALLGTYDDNQSNDYTLPNGNIFPINSTPQKIHDYGMQWGISASESLFTYPPCKNFASYDNKNFVPSFGPPNLDNLPPESVAACKGNNECLFDLAVTGQLDLAMSTLETVEKYEAFVKINAVTCTRPMVVTANGYLDGTNYFVGSSVKLVCNKKFKVKGTDTITCKRDFNGQLSWDGQLGTCVDECDNPNLWLKYLCEQNLAKLM